VAAHRGLPTHLYTLIGLRVDHPGAPRPAAGRHRGCRPRTSATRRAAEAQPCAV